MIVQIRGIILAVVVATFATMLNARVAVSQDAVDSSSLAELVKRLQAARSERRNDNTLESRIRETTWRLLIGELATAEDVTLSSGGYDALKRGLDELNTLLGEVNADSESVRKLMEQPHLVMRLDAAVARRADAEVRREISRADELSRLSQLRELNREYRELIQQLLGQQTDFLLGRTDEVARRGAATAQRLTAAEQVVAKRRDYYLFKDEPGLENDTAELELVKQLALPFSNDARTHNEALRALTLCRLAGRNVPESEELYKAGLAQAEAAIGGNREPNSVALYARGIACLELGRLSTKGAVFSRKAHEAAADWFARSLDALAKSEEAVPQGANLPEWAAEMKRLQGELRSHEPFVAAAGQLEARGDHLAAISELERGMSLHRSAPLIMSWLEVRWRSGTMQLDEIDQRLAEAISDGAVNEDNVAMRSLRGRIGVQGVWQALSEVAIGGVPKDRLAALQKRLASAIADLRSIPENAEPALRFSSSALVALGELTLLLIDGARDPGKASQELERLPIALAELDRLVPLVDPVLRLQIREAALAGRLAEGYLALRLLPEYKDRAQLAFAAAMDLVAEMPFSAGAPRPLGGAALKALWGRDRDSVSRVAQEERQLRQLLQRLLPSVVAMQMGDTGLASDNLVKTTSQMSQIDPPWNPSQAIDPRDFNDARQGVLADSRAIAALALISAARPEAAVRQILTTWWPDLGDSFISTLDWNAVQEKARQLREPLTLYTLALAVEELAVTAEVPDKPGREKLLSMARLMEDQVAKHLETTSIWRERWPQLVSLNTAARERLASDQIYVKRAESLRNELRLSDSRKVLDQGLLRHPNSVALRGGLVQCLIDEAETDAEHRPELLARAISSLEQGATLSDTTGGATALLLADLNERLGRDGEAISWYREVSSKSTDATQKIKAKSRLAALRVRQISAK